MKKKYSLRNVNINDLWFLIHSDKLYYLTAEGDTWDEFVDSADIFETDRDGENGRSYKLIHADDLKISADARRALTIEFNRVNSSETNLPAPKMITAEVKVPSADRYAKTESFRGAAEAEADFYNTKTKMSDTILKAAKELFTGLESLPLDQKVDTINKLRLLLREYSPFKTEPVDCVQWVKNTEVTANDYNPNTVAPPEMKLLELSVQEDGYTQPIVSWKRDEVYEVVDGFHRHRVGKESKDIQKRIKGYLPLVVINENRTDISDRMASTIRHNRARGKHGVESMSDIVVELKKRNRSDDWIAKHLGMDPDEVLRLCQVSGLTEMFSNSQFSRSWEIDSYQKDENITNIVECGNETNLS